MGLTLLQGSYIIAGLLFILALAGLSKHESAKSGNAYGMVGMGIALIITVLGAVFGIDAAGTDHDIAAGHSWAIWLILLAVLIGASIGIWRARRVEMTGMPELIAMLHSFVGLAAVLVGYNSYLVPGEGGKIHLGEVFVGVFIGAVTFTGSIIAFLKLSARMKSAPLMLPGHNYINLGAIVAFLGLTVWFVMSPALWLLVLMTVIALALGLHLVASIGGGDMPVVVSMLNSYSGWAAAAA
jgi:NAD(P) transhydrogenase subunit beta